MTLSQPLSQLATNGVNDHTVTLPVNEMRRPATFDDASDAAIENKPAATGFAMGCA